jgi:hypothetical protein
MSSPELSETYCYLCSQESLADASFYPFDNTTREIAPKEIILHLAVMLVVAASCSQNEQCPPRLAML